MLKVPVESERDTSCTTASAASAARRRRSRGLLVLLALVAIVLVARAAHKERGVLLNNQAFGQRFLDGQDPYLDPVLGHRVHGPYPPSFTLVASPLALLPARLARIAWASAQILALGVVYRLLRRQTKRVVPGLGERSLGFYALALLLVSRFLLRDMAAGGGNLLYMTLALMGLELSWSHRPWLSGLPTGLGLALKPNLAPLLLYYAVSKKPRVLASTLLCALGFFFLPSLYCGPAAYGRLVSDWGSSVAAYATLEDVQDASEVPDGLPPPEGAMNQSLREAVARLFRPAGDTGAPDIHLWQLEASTTAWIARGLSILLILLACGLVYLARSRLAEWLAALGMLPLCLLVSPISWKAHHVILLPLLYALLCAGATRPRLVAWLPRALVAYYVVCDLTSTEIVGQRANDFLQAISIVTWSNFALIALVALLVLRSRQTSVDSDSPAH